MMFAAELVDRYAAGELAQLFASDLLSRSVRKRSPFASVFSRGQVANGSWRFREDLDVEALDFSIGSLQVVDDHLERIYNSLPKGADGKRIEVLGDEQIFSIVPTIGCYVGEVIRRNGRDDNRWYYYTEMIDARPSLTRIFGENPTASTMLALSTGGEDFLLPLGKVYKFLLDGPGDATTALAKLVTQKRLQ